MGQDAARTVREIEQIRARIDAELDELGDALPPRDELIGRAVAAAVGGVVAILTVWYALHRFKVNRQDRRVKRIVQDAIRELDGS